MNMNYEMSRSIQAGHEHHVEGYTLFRYIQLPAQKVLVALWSSIQHAQG